MSDFYKKLVTALQSVSRCIQDMVTRTNTSFSSNVVQRKQHEYCATMLFYQKRVHLKLLTCAYFTKVFTSLKCIWFVVSNAYYMHIFVVCTQQHLRFSSMHL